MKILIVDDIRTSDNIHLVDPSILLYDNIEWELAINYDQAIQKISNNLYDVITLDHDLGEEKTGYDIANWIEESIVNGSIIHSEIRCHSANPVGKTRINQVIKSIERFR